MGTTTANMSLQKPTLGGDPGTYDDQLNASLDLLDVHDHTTGRGVRVPSAGLNINADLTFAGYGQTNVKAVKFTAQTPSSMGSYPGSLFLGNDGEFYLRSPGGTNIRVTSSGTLNVSLVGGIAGDYSSAGASLYYDDANQAYRFLEAAPLPNSWSRVLCGDLDLYEHASGITNRVRLQSPSGLAASYAITLPSALPASTATLRMSSAGVITADTSVELPLHASLAVAAAATATHGSSGYLTWAATGAAYMPIPVPVGKTITAIHIEYSRDSGSSLSFSLVEYNGDGTGANIVQKTVNAGAGAATTELGTSPTSGSLPKTLATGKSYQVVFSMHNTDDLYQVRVVYGPP